ncbi:internal scaffolding protein [Blackfly microvirus SF02]|uniref:Internal scaffolding protein n=1 Tax=Blackfly microvirus SF02 TaxID=2576452 RepID=A0A4P8PM07_9VIRU|nr:internal scaffolding protein [Blackfly microvirus SF02]
MRIQGLNCNGEELSSSYVEHDPVDFVPEGPSLTRQEFADECDINTLMAQYEKTGVINHFNSATPQYYDLTEMPDTLMGSLEHMKNAEEAFMRLPALVRKEFDNDPISFVVYATDPENLTQLREWGLAAPEKPAGALKQDDAKETATSSAKASPEAP